MNIYQAPRGLIMLACTVLLSACDGPSTYVHQDAGEAKAEEVGIGKDSPVSLVGEKFFRENRFSQYFFAHFSDAYNQPPAHGDRIVDSVEALTNMYKSPYKGQAISCAACHFVDQNKDTPELGVRAYTDFSRRSRIPDRGDGQERTVRNSGAMVSMALHDGMFLHGDGEYAKPEDLIRESYYGRNMGWLPLETKQAIHHLAEVVRQDNGAYPTDTDLSGLNYHDLLTGAATIPSKFMIPVDFRIDVRTASDEEIFAAVIRLVGQYIRALDFARDANGNFNGSPYDMFLTKNHLPSAPRAQETTGEYAARLLNLINTTKSLAFVSNDDGKFTVQKQDFVFAEKELAGLRTFFGAAQCVQCHSAPDFTDHLFHNTGVSQLEYDQVHGAGAFANLSVPNLKTRNQHANTYLPQSEQYPQALSELRSIPTLSKPRLADLGAWIVFLNPAMPNPQVPLRSAICQSLHLECALISDDEILQNSLGLIKTPSLRDLGQSSPYLHTGQADQLEDVMRFYEQFSALAREKKVRNADPLMSAIVLSPTDEANVVRFMKALNEDYQ